MGEIQSLKHTLGEEKVSLEFSCIRLPSAVNTSTVCMKRFYMQLLVYTKEKKLERAICYLS